MNYDAQNWYWLADDGRVYSSGRQAVVDASDPAYNGWIALGGGPTRWPDDGGGQQTSASLQDVLTPYGLFASLDAYAAARRWAREVGGIIVGGIPIATDDRSKLMITGARLAAEADPDWSTTWLGADGSSHPLTAAQMIAVSDGVAAHVNACFLIYSAVVLEITAGTITEQAQVDAAFSV